MAIHMETINIQGLGYREINQRLRKLPACRLTACCGQRFIGAGMGAQEIIIEGVPGNALGAYLNGGSITVYGNAQDAVGDTMDAGDIFIHGSVGDAAGYAMRGGRIFVKGDAGYRAGIHMKAYGDKAPVMVIGGKAGSFLGEYQAGGTIIVLALQSGGAVGNFPCTGMHGGKLLLRGGCEDIVFPSQVTARSAAREDLEEALVHLETFCKAFGYDMDRVLDSPFTTVTPDSRNPYRQMYVMN